MASWVWRRYNGKKQIKHETILHYLKYRGGVIKVIPPEIQDTSFQYTRPKSKDQNQEFQFAVFI